MLRSDAQRLQAEAEASAFDADDASHTFMHEQRAYDHLAVLGELLARGPSQLPEGADDDLLERLFSVAEAARRHEHYVLENGQLKAAAAIADRRRALLTNRQWDPALLSALLVGRPRSGAQTDADDNLE